MSRLCQLFFVGVDRVEGAGRKKKDGGENGGGRKKEEGRIQIKLKENRRY